MGLINPLGIRLYRNCLDLTEETIPFVLLWTVGHRRFGMILTKERLRNQKRKLRNYSSYLSPLLVWIHDNNFLLEKCVLP